MLSILILTVLSSETANEQIENQDIDNLFANGNKTYSISKHREVCRKINYGQIKLEELRQDFADALASQELVKAELNSWKLDNLKQLLYYARGKKQEIIEQILNAMLREFAINQSISYLIGGKGSYLSAIKKAVLKVTQADLDKQAAEYAAKLAFKEKSTNNPETKEEFEYFVRVFGEKNLSREQRSVWDQIRGVSNLQKQEQQLAQKALVSQVKLEAIDFNLIEHYHTNRGHNVFTVTLSGRVDKDTFDELCQKARQLGGNYAKAWRDKTNNTTSPSGFTFNEKEQAQKFINLKEGNVSCLDELKERQEEKKANAVEHLSQIAENLSEKAQETLVRDRKVNTERRARMAKSAENGAREDLQLASTIARIAEAIKSGQSKFLSGVRAKTHIETLETILSSAKYKRRSKLDEKYEDIKHTEPELADVDFVQYPYPTLNLEHLCAVQSKALSGLLLITNRFTKLFTPKNRQLGYIVIKEVSSIKDLQKMIYKTKKVDSYLADMMGDRLVNYQRLQLIGLTDTPSLRAALREYLSLRTDTPKGDPIKEMERELIGCRIDSYFPTPKALVEQMLNLAEIGAEMDVLEPSAGAGHIADAIRHNHPKANLSVVEINSRLREILKAKGHNLVDWDFLKHTQTYHRIIMNPPFENFQDAKHVKNAWSLLKEGGKLVAIMSESPFFRMDREAVAFRDWLEAVGGTSEKLPQGSFLESERSTGVATRIIVVDKANTTAVDPSETTCSTGQSQVTDNLKENSVEDLLEKDKTSIEEVDNSSLELAKLLLEIKEIVEKPFPKDGDFLKLDVSQSKVADKTLHIDDYEAIKDRFLEHEEIYETIIINSIVYGQEQIEHIYHAYYLLAPGGMLAVTLPDTVITPTNKVYSNFHRWLRYLNASSEAIFDNKCLLKVKKTTLF